MNLRHWCCLAVLVCSPLPTPLAAADPKEHVLADCLLLPPAGRGGRSPLVTDALYADILTRGWRTPKDGDKLVVAEGPERVWKAARAKDGGISDRVLLGGYVYWQVNREQPGVLLLEARGQSFVLVNGEPRAGDPYSNGVLVLPVALRKGENHLLFQVARGSLNARLITPAQNVFLEGRDGTLPDLVEEQRQSQLGAVVLVNASEKPLSGWTLQAKLGEQTTSTPVPWMPPLMARKVPFTIPARTGDASEVRLTLGNQQSPEHSTLKVGLRVRKPTETRKVTFLSEIDGSVQHYAVNPARPARATANRPALFLSLHGASVEAIGQADAYSPKTWGHLVAPTNRRPFGFDWEDWGRLDAIEVLEHAQKTLNTDPQRVYLTGHSMGGHGTWHVGATFPDRFAAIGPSAGWVSFWTYAGGRRPDSSSPLIELLTRCTSPSDTLGLARNYAGQGVYVLHGDADDNVPVDQARAMRSALEKFHRDWMYFEQPKAGHWWDASDEPGADCVDWAPMFELFARRSIPLREAVRDVDFTTGNPAVSAWCHWVGIEAQLKAMQLSKVQLRFDPWQRRFRGTTDNVARLALDVGHLAPGEPILVELDGQKLDQLAWPRQGTRLWFQREGDAWKAVGAPSLQLKGPHRAGPFKEAFRQRMLFVYGTQGTGEENAWAQARARYDAETFWYRGNGSVEVIPDSAFDARKEPERNVILYGHADCNAAWKPLLADSPVQVRRGKLTAGDRTLSGEDLTCLMIRPRPGSERASVGVVGGTGLLGLHVTERMPYFVSGTGYPDCLIVDASVLTKGQAGVRAAGFFGNDWSLSKGEFIWPTGETK